MKRKSRTIDRTAEWRIKMNTQYPRLYARLLRRVQDHKTANHKYLP